MRLKKGCSGNGAPCRAQTLIVVENHGLKWTVGLPCALQSAPDSISLKFAFVFDVPHSGLVKGSRSNVTNWGVKCAKMKPEISIMKTDTFKLPILGFIHCL